MKASVIWFLFVFISVHAFSQTNIGPFTICESKSDYSVEYLKDGKKKKIYENSAIPTIRNLGNSMYSLSFSCGSPCNYSIFINDSSGNVSKPFFLVLAFDPIKEVVLYCADTVVLESMFSHKLYKEIKLDYSPSVSPFTVISNAKIEEGTLEFSYLSGDSFDEKKFAMKIEE